MTTLDVVFECRECGQRVDPRQRHTFVDCALFIHRRDRALSAHYGPALAIEVERLREERRLLRDVLTRVADAQAEAAALLTAT